MPNATVIRTADRPDYSPLYDYLFLYASMSLVLCGCLSAHVCISVHTDVAAWGAKGASFSFLIVCSQLSFCLRCVFCVSIHQSDKVSLCVRMKDPARQTERKRKRQIEKKTWSYSCLPVCLHLFVSFLSVCSPHSRRSTLVTVFGDGEDRKGEIMW